MQRAPLRVAVFALRSHRSLRGPIFCCFSESEWFVIAKLCVVLAVCGAGGSAGGEPWGAHGAHHQRHDTLFGLIGIDARLQTALGLMLRESWWALFHSNLHPTPPHPNQPRSDTEMTIRNLTHPTGTNYMVSAPANCFPALIHVSLSTSLPPPPTPTHYLQPPGPPPPSTLSN